MSDRKLIVSLTSFPARIRFVPRVLESLLAQTRPAGAIVLYLSEDQFPGREADLPEELTAAAEAGSLLLRFVPGDLKPHKKYFYAFREYPDAYVVTVDDDALYSPALLEDLWQTHLAYPDAVVAGRAHLITLDSAGAPRPYQEWVRRVMGFEQGPSLQLCAVGVGGVLYDPGRFPPELFDEEALRASCLEADDLWLKAMELAAGIPVVRARGVEYLRLVPGSQENSLYHVNVNQNRNDELLARVRKWTAARFGRDLFMDWSGDGSLPVVRTEADLSAFLLRDRKRRMDDMTDLASGLEISLKRTSDRLSALEQTAEGLRNTAEHLRQEKDRVKEVNDRLKEVNDRLKESNDKLRESNDRFRESNAGLKETNAGLRETVARLRDYNTRLKESNTGLKEANAGLKEDKAALKKERELLRQEKESLKAELDLLQNSSSYKLGRALTAPVRKLKKE